MNSNLTIILLLQPCLLCRTPLTFDWLFRKGRGYGVNKVIPKLGTVCVCVRVTPVLLMTAGFAGQRARDSSWSFIV
jgi:hypothetical protein